MSEVNHPDHYTRGGIETIDFITAKGLCYELGNVIKYVSRAQFKGCMLQDLQKAHWYLTYKIAQLEDRATRAVDVEERLKKEREQFEDEVL